MSEERKLTKKDIPEEMRPSKWGVRIVFLLMLLLCLFIIIEKIIIEGKTYELLFLIPIIFLGITSAYYHEDNMIKNFTRNHDKYMKGIREENPLRYRYLMDKWSIMMFCGFLISFILMSILINEYFRDRSYIMGIISSFFYIAGFNTTEAYLHNRFYHSLPDE